jgi:hypothetical protein
MFEVDNIYLTIKHILSRLTPYLCEITQLSLTRNFDNQAGNIPLTIKHILSRSTPYVCEITQFSLTRNLDILD